MNLASRCREAISHVAMLKKELAVQKRRGEEVNRQQPPAAHGRSTSPPAVSPSKQQQQQPQTLDVVEEIGRMDRILAAHQQARTEPPVVLRTPTSSPKPKITDIDEPVSDKAPPPAAASEEKKDSEEDTDDEVSPPHLVSSDDYEEDDVPVGNALTEDDEASQPPSLSPSKIIRSLGESEESSPSPSSFKGILREKSTSSQVDVDAVNVDDDDDDYDEEEMGDRMPSPAKAPPPGEGTIFPQTASPIIRGGYNEEFPGDITAAAVRHHHHLHQPRLGRFEESDAVLSTSNDSDPPAPEQQPGPFERLRQRSAMSTISSIDAFEASFQTDFPESFSPRDDNEKKSSTDAYNPFSPSPQRPSFNGSEDDGEEDDDCNVIDLEPQVRSHQSSPPSSGIRERALSAASSYRRANGNRQSAASDPPGRDRTSTRKSKAPVASASQQRSSRSGNNTPSPSIARKVVTDGSASSALPASPLASGNRSPLSNGTPKMKLPVINVARSPSYEGSSGSPRLLRNTSPATPSQTSSPVASEAYRTPSPMSQLSPHDVSEPSRPEKTGHDQARARYEKAYGSSKHRVNGADTSFATATSDTSDSLPRRSNRVRNGIRARVVEYEKASSPIKLKHQADALYAPATPEDEDGDIPMHSSISKASVSPSKNRNGLLFDATRKYGSARGIDVSEDDELRLNPNKGGDLLYGGPSYTKDRSAGNLMRSEEVVRNGGWR